jgi:transposase-like protein
MRKLLKKNYAPNVLVTDKLPSYGCARRDLGLSARRDRGRRTNNRAENSHQVVRRGAAPHAERQVGVCRSRAGMLQ